MGIVGTVNLYFLSLNPLHRAYGYRTYHNLFHDPRTEVKDIIVIFSVNSEANTSEFVENFD